MGPESKGENKEKRVEITWAWETWDLEGHIKNKFLKEALDRSIYMPAFDAK